jgi:PAS domain S-box-containing protein
MTPPSTSEIDLRSGVRITADVLAVAVELMPDGAVVIDARGSIVAVNAQASTLFGYEPRELVGMDVEILVPERLRPRHRDQRAKYLLDPLTRAMGDGAELPGRRRDGSEVPVDISLAPLEVGGRPLALAGIRDATERRKAGAAQAQLAAIVQSSHDGLLALGLDGRILSWNPGAEATFGYRPDEIVGTHVSRLFADDASAAFEELLDRALRERHGVPDDAPPARDTTWLCRDGTPVAVAVSVSPMHAAETSEDRLIGFSVLVRDISERKHAEHELRRLLDVVTHRERWQAGTAEIRLALLSGSPLHEVLGLVGRWSLDLLDARRVALFALDAAEAPSVLFDLAGDAGERGTPSADARGELAADLPDERWDELRAGRTVATTAPVRGAVARSEQDGDRPLAAILAVPVVVQGEARFAFVVTARGGRSFSSHDATVACSLAEQTAMAMELDRARADQELLVVAGERERIARDLHDLVIQRLFAAGMSLQGVLRLIDDNRAAERVESVVDALDDTIRELRNSIFVLTRPDDASSSLRAEIQSLLDEAGGNLGFRPVAHFNGPIDSAVPASLTPHAVAVVREALSNIVRHAGASAVRVDVTVGSELTVAVTDDGVGLQAQGRRSGLANLRSRAVALEGTFELVTRPEHAGTRLVWRVPI